MKPWRSGCGNRGELNLQREDLHVTSQDDTSSCQLHSLSLDCIWLAALN